MNTAILLARPSIALIVLITTARANWDEMRIRHTNVDLVAARLEEISGKDDLIIVPHWEDAISFTRYYHGPSQLMTLPPLADHSLHRYDLVVDQMKTSDALGPVMSRMSETLQSGHRVYFAGELPAPPADQRLPVLHPFYKDENGVPHGSGYYRVWESTAGQFLAAHSKTMGSISFKIAGYDHVQEYEKLPLGAAEGWRN